MHLLWTRGGRYLRIATVSLQFYEDFVTAVHGSVNSRTFLGAARPGTAPCPRNAPCATGCPMPPARPPPAPQVRGLTGWIPPAPALARCAPTRSTRAWPSTDRAGPCDLQPLPLRHYPRHRPRKSGRIPRRGDGNSPSSPPPTRALGGRDYGHSGMTVIIVLPAQAGIQCRAAVAGQGTGSPPQSPRGSAPARQRPSSVGARTPTPTYKPCHQ